jgi:hypothetical protein
MSKIPVATATASLRRELLLHVLRLRRLKKWREAVGRALRERECDAALRAKAMDTTPSTETLDYERETLDREIRMHTVLVALGRDRRALRMLEDVVADPALARHAATDARAFSEARGVQLPRQLHVRVDVMANRVRVEIDYIERPFAASFAFP